MKKRTLTIPMQTRRATLTPSTLNTEKRTVDVIWSSASSVRRYDWWDDRVFIEEMDLSGANLERLNGGAPVLNTHSDESLTDVVGVVERAWLNDDKTQGLATIRFSNRAEVEPVFKDVQDGIIRNISIGYSIEEAQEIKAVQGSDQPDILRVTRFTPQEISLVPIPADPSAQILRSAENRFTLNLFEETSMPPDENKSETQPDVVKLRREFERAKQLGAREAILADRKRVSDLDELFKMPIIPRDEFFQSIRTRAIDDGWTVDATRKYLLDALNDGAEPVFEHEQVVGDGDMGITSAPPAYQSARAKPAAAIQPASWNRRSMGRVEITRDATETTVESIEQAIMVRCRIATKEMEQEARERGFAGLTYVEMGRKLFEASGQGSRVQGMDKHGLSKIMITRTAGPQTTSDFPGILANVTTKIAKAGYAEAPTTYQQWCNIAYLSDFKPATIPGLGAFTDLDKIPRAGGPYYFGTMGESYETAQLATYGKLFGISREALVNDDLNEFASVARKMGASAARTVNSLAYAVLTGNQTMTEDNTACFIAGHNNYVGSGSGAAPSSTTLNVAEGYMLTQTAPVASGDATAAYLNISPAYLLVPVALGATARVLVTSEFDPSATAAINVPNIWRGRLEVVIDAALGGTTGKAWYLAAPKGNSVVDTVTVYFLEGSGAAPYIEEQQMFQADGLTYKVRIDAVARALDFRGLFYNAGQ